MRESEWLVSNDPAEMIMTSRVQKENRKLRLFACACCEHLKRWTRSPIARKALGRAYEVADGVITLDTGRKWGSKVRSIGISAHLKGNVQASLVCHMIDVALGVRKFSNRKHVWSLFFQDTKKLGAKHHSELTSTETVLIRDIFGNPFRPVEFNPRWRTSDVVGLARAIYDDRAFERMPILADALMDAGCENEEIIGHCRGDGPHVRGCWVVDLILGKE